MQRVPSLLIITATLGLVSAGKAQERTEISPPGAPAVPVTTPPASAAAPIAAPTDPAKPPEPTPSSVDVAAPTVTSAPTPAPATPAAAAAPAQATAPPLAGAARVRAQVSRPNAWLETRPFGVEEDFRQVCRIPCAEPLVVDGMELRVTAPGMTPSAPFRVERGSGDAFVRVNGGSASARSLGRTSLAVGLPLTLLGAAGFGYGSVKDQAGLKTAGAITLGVGALLSLVALPLLVSGSTSVRNDKGDLIARAVDGFSF